MQVNLLTKKNNNIELKDLSRDPLDAPYGDETDCNTD